jgi:LuxR family transcriptional regulator, maltose regulon positive regulatory protein
VKEGNKSDRSTAVPLHVVERPRLTQLLDEASARIILLAAPAGYGKTTLARQWLANEVRTSVWFRATASSTDVAVLGSGLARAISGGLGVQCERIVHRLRGSSSPNSEAWALGEILADDLRDWPPNAWLVLDDYQGVAASPAAELFVQALVEHAPVRVLLTARQRPAWVSTRDVLYGNVFELGQNALAMTHGEAAAALGTSSNSDHLSGLVALAEGWPAVIGLASLTSTSFANTQDEVPEALYDFFASELYRELDEELREDVSKLALASTINLRLASELFGNRATAVLAEAERRGFLARHESQYELHPLLRQFLILKLQDLDRSALHQLAAQICQWEIGERNWNEALQLADRYQLSSLVFAIIEATLDDVLAQGRIASVQKWLDVARKHDAASPTISLVEMEISFRRHQFDQARSHAQRLISKLPVADHRLSRALHRMGQIGHLDDHYDDAVSFLSSARATAQTTHDLRAALWSQFITVADHGDQVKAREILGELNEVPNANVDDLLRLSQGELHLAARWGGVEAELRRQSGSLSLVGDSVDPVVRTGFLQTYGTALLLAADYDQAIAIAHRQVDEAESSGLKWVRPPALELRGAAEWGLREFDSAASSLREAYQLSEAQSDVHGQLNSSVLLARTHLAQGAPERALEAMTLEFDRPPGPTMQGDFLAARALAHACTGDHARAIELAGASEKCTDHIDARVVRAFARAIVTLTTDSIDTNMAAEAVEAALHEAHITENYDAFVLAYRAHPAVLSILSRLESPSAFACRSRIPECDRRLAERAGLKPRSSTHHLGDPLTPREQEVLGLLSSGLSNREIARTLWIAESTAKVHVRNVLKKLGARSRTEAASLSSQH